jgi:23S rRNA (adenine2030-N6)-methyltransferase
MKYKHSFHAGNFADVHKHVALLALLAALKRKEKGFLYLETHAGRGAYDLGANSESAGGIGKLVRNAADLGEEIRAYLEQVKAHQARTHAANGYPGSPLLACGGLREQDRAVLIELQAPEAAALQRAVAGTPLAARVKVERGDGFELMKAHLPPAERRGLTFIDPPYEENGKDFTRVTQAIGDAMRRFATGVMAAWYPIKDERTTQRWHAQLAQQLTHEALLAELWLYPRDTRVGLNGSGLLILNPPYRVAERMQIWQAELLSALGARPGGGTSVRELPSDWRKLPSVPK